MKAHEGWVGAMIAALVTGLVLLTSEPIRESSRVYAGSKEAAAPPRAQGARLAAPATAAVLGYLQTRDHRITIYPGGVYTVATKDGKVLAERVPLDSLRASDPALHQILERALASRNRVQDARVYRAGPLATMPGDQRAVRGEGQ